MNCSQNSVQILKEIQKMKYKKAVIPILVIALSFILNAVWNYEWSKYIAAIGLLGYFAIVIRFRISKSLLPQDENIIISPVSGKITAYEEDDKRISIIVERKFWDFADFRRADSSMSWLDEKTLLSDRIEVIFTGKIKKFENDDKSLGALSGVILDSKKIKINLSKTLKIDFNKNDKIKSGETIIARY